MKDKALTKPKHEKQLGDDKPPAASAARLRVVAAVVIVAALVGALAYYRSADEASKRAAAKKERDVPVVVARATIQQVPIRIKTIGNVLPYSVVNVLPQVNGQLTKVYFTQGQFVRKGDPLFQIDPSPYQAALDQAEGNVARDRAQIQTAQANLARDLAQVGQLRANLQKDSAQLKFASAEKERYNMLVNQGAVSREQSDQMMTNEATGSAAVEADRKAIENALSVVNADRAMIDTARGTLKADEAAAKNARIQLGWTLIRSPIDGRTGSLNVYQGNIVNANNANTPLVSIYQVQPIYISFTVAEQYLDQIRRAMASNTLRVQALLEGVKTDSVEGAVSFLENSVNTTTGTVTLRATFANADKHLYPGQFVDVIVTMPPDGKTVVIPASAVQTSQQGNCVYVVRPGNKVDFLPVDLRRTYGEWAAIGSGINAGDVVVTDGQLQLIPGARVRIVREERRESGR